MWAGLVMVLETRLHMRAYVDSASLVSEVRRESIVLVGNPNMGSPHHWCAIGTSGEKRRASMISSKLFLGLSKPHIPSPPSHVAPLGRRHHIDLADVSDLFILAVPPVPLSAHSPSPPPPHAPAPSRHA